ncbi:DUF1839 family protein [Porticoccus sp. GXU_MW_L64]
MLHQLITLDPDNYPRHRIHSEDWGWQETNCYVDVLIELLHANNLEPLAALPFTFGVDFEGDQWTFFKFPHQDLMDLFGLAIEELNPWYSLCNHVNTQLKNERSILVEVDSYHLPDTRATTYQSEHVKTTIAVNAIDIENKFLGYFHGQGYYHLTGEDFDNLFRTNETDEKYLPPYIELVKFSKEPPGSENGLREKSINILKKRLKEAPAVNPFSIYKEQFLQDIQWLHEEPMDTYHKYSFATFRQFGTCYGLAAMYLRWLSAGGEKNLDEAIDCFDSISHLSRIAQFQLARAVARRELLEMSIFDKCANSWARGMQALMTKYD